MNTEFIEEIDKAARLHGHLGPFLVLGVRMGRLAMKTFPHSGNVVNDLRVRISVPQTTPFTCAIDGIQSSTHCTIGNRRLAVAYSTSEITAEFESIDSNQKLKIQVKPTIIEEVIHQLKNVNNESVVSQISAMDDGKLFTIEKS